mmetsp:Transcript_49921/g.139763  ORF Transcript_49921/g.139763 Transcript_49921/m.139763 type:complete len:304 (-) Transcript_49921:148-1059(-)
MAADQPTVVGEANQCAPPEPGGGDEAREHYLACAACTRLVLGAADLIEERAETWQETVYAYELGVCERDCWCYSATNPGDVRFDVVRVLPSAEGVALSSAPVPEHSWFPGYAWMMANCRSCHQHLGWGYCAPEPAGCADVASDVDGGARSPTDCGDQEGSAAIPRGPTWQQTPCFLGLILTRLRPATLTRTEASSRRAPPSFRMSAILTFLRGLRRGRDPAWEDDLGHRDALTRSRGIGEPDLDDDAFMELFEHSPGIQEDSALGSQDGGDGLAEGAEAEVLRQGAEDVEEGEVAENAEHESG